MARESAELTPVVGAHVRRVRQARGLSVTELARLAGLARATLTELEAGQGNPTLETLSALGQVLAVPVGDLLTDPPEGTDPAVVRAAEGPVVERDTVRYRLVQRIARDEVVTELWEAAVSPGRHVAGPMPAGTLAHVYVSSGRLTVGPVEQPVALGPRDFAVYLCDRQHLFEAARPARVLICLTYDPTSAHQALSRHLTP